jgi:hypothetical protein
MGRGPGGGQCWAFIALTFSWKGKKIENLSLGFDHGFPARRFQLLLIFKSPSLHHLLRWYLSLAVFPCRGNSYCIDIGLREVNWYHIYSNEIIEQILGNGRTGCSWYWPWKVGYQLSSLHEVQWGPYRSFLFSSTVWQTSAGPMPKSIPWNRSARLGVGESASDPGWYGCHHWWICCTVDESVVPCLGVAQAEKLAYIFKTKWQS